MIQLTFPNLEFPGFHRLPVIPVPQGHRVTDQKKLVNLQGDKIPAKCPLSKAEESLPGFTDQCSSFSVFSRRCQERVVAHKGIQLFEIINLLLRSTASHKPIYTCNIYILSDTYGTIILYLDEWIIVWEMFDSKPLIELWEFIILILLPVVTK